MKKLIYISLLIFVGSLSCMHAAFERGKYKLGEGSERISKKFAAKDELGLVQEIEDLENYIQAWMEDYHTRGLDEILEGKKPHGCFDYYYRNLGTLTQYVETVKRYKYKNKAVVENLVNQMNSIISALLSCAQDRMREF